MFDKLLERLIHRIEIDGGVDGWPLGDEAAYVRNELARDRGIDVDEDYVLYALLTMNEKRRRE